MMRAAMIGVGSWGLRVATRLAAMDGVDLHSTYDTDPKRKVFDTPSFSSAAGMLEWCRPDAVVIATPPTVREALVATVIGAGVKRIRIEKPLATDLATATRIAAMCQAHGVELTVGYTLLHHPLYEAAFAYADLLGGAQQVRGLRVGRPPAHPVNPVLDLGIHGASIAAHLGLRGEFVTAYMPAAQARRTEIVTPGGLIVVDELALKVHTPHGAITIDADHDALGRDLAAWIAGTHRGTPDVALRAQRAVELREVATCVA